MLWVMKIVTLENVADVFDIKPDFIEDGDNLERDDNITGEQERHEEKTATDANNVNKDD